MASYYKCTCGARVGTNLFSGNGIMISIHEDFFEDDIEMMSSTELKTKIIMSGKKIITCKSCGRLYIFGADAHHPEEYTPRPEIG